VAIASNRARLFGSSEGYRFEWESDLAPAGCGSVVLGACRVLQFIPTSGWSHFWVRSGRSARPCDWDCPKL